MQVEFERLELKYLVDEGTAEGIRRAVGPYCVPDAHNGRQGHGYWISSLYFDSPRLAFFHAKERSDHDRVKLRARIYDPAGDVHLEIKRKKGDVVTKKRVIVAKDAWVDAVRGFGEPLVQQPSQERILSSFCQIAAQYGVEPRVVVEYEREAYISCTGEYARVSFDRRVAAFATRDHSFDGDRWALRAVPMTDDPASSAGVLVELKCETLMPPWILDIVRSFQLRRVGHSKYNRAIRLELARERASDPWLQEMANG